jgi:hypothetical protein
VARSVVARSGGRQVGLRIVDSGGWRVAWIGVLRAGTGADRLTGATAAHRRVDAFVSEVFRRDPTAVRGRWSGR